nr:GDSL-type esterase/lipase family protein [uncultured Cohaesibacter sp.]
MRRVCFVGASNIEGMGDEDGLGWPLRLWQKYKGTDNEFVCYNLGIRGQTMNQFLKRAEHECEQRFHRTSHPIIVLGTGANDLSRFAEGEFAGKPRTPQTSLLRTFRALLSELSSIATLLVIGPPVIDADRMPFKMAKLPTLDFRNEDIETFSQIYQDICCEANIPFFNLYAALSQNQLYGRSLKAGVDGLHPTGLGYQEIAEHIRAWDAWRQTIETD